MKIKNFQLHVRGKIGPVIISRRHGKYYIRTATTGIKQAAITRRYNQNFGLAATAGSKLRQQLVAALPFPKQKQVQSNFSGRIYSWLGQQPIAGMVSQEALPFISGFSFNEKASLAASCKLAFAVTQPGSRELQVALPAFVPTVAFKAPKGTKIIECVFAAAYCNLLKPAAAVSDSVCRLQVPFTGTPVGPQSISLPLPGSKACLLVTALRLNFIDGRGAMITKPAAMPAAVVDARYCQA